MRRSNWEGFAWTGAKRRKVEHWRWSAWKADTDEEQKKRNMDLLKKEKARLLSSSIVAKRHR